MRAVEKEKYRELYRDLKTEEAWENEGKGRKGERNRGRKKGKRNRGRKTARLDSYLEVGAINKQAGKLQGLRLEEEQVDIKGKEKGRPRKPQIKAFPRKVD